MFEDEGLTTAISALNLFFNLLFILFILLFTILITAEWINLVEL